MKDPNCSAKKKNTNKTWFTPFAHTQGATLGILLECFYSGFGIQLGLLRSQDFEINLDTWLYCSKMHTWASYVFGLGLSLSLQSVDSYQFGLLICKPSFAFVSWIFIETRPDFELGRLTRSGPCNNQKRIGPVKSRHLAEPTLEARKVKASELMRYIDKWKFVPSAKPTGHLKMEVVRWSTDIWNQIKSELKVQNKSHQLNTI